MSEDKIIKKLIEHDGRFDNLENQIQNLATRDDIQRILNILDHLIKETEDNKLQTASLNHLYFEMRKDIDELKINSQK